MKQIGRKTKRALILFTLLAPLAFAPSQTRAEEPVLGPGVIICGGPLGYSYSEPFWVGDVWSIQVTAPCSDGSTEYGTGPVAPNGGIDDPIVWSDDGGE